MKECEGSVVVVGAGVAGAFLAYQLAAKGLPVLVFDHTVPREKPCGGGITHLAYKRFPFLENLDYPRQRVQNYLFVGSDGSHHGGELAAPLTIVPRQAFDQALLDQALTAGARLVRQKVVDVQLGDGGLMVRAGEQTIGARILVGADGLHSVVRRKLIGPFAKRHIGVAFGYFLKGGLDLTRVVLRCYSDLEGYLWFFPRSDHASMGICGAIGGQRRRDILLARLEGCIAELGLHPEKRVPWQGLLPLVNDPRFYNRPVCGPNWLLVGDAAGHVHPLLGEGILYALLGAEQAAQAIGLDQVEAYDTLWRRLFGPSLIRAAALRKHLEALDWKQRCAYYEEILRPSPASLFSSAYILTKHPTLA